MDKRDLREAYEIVLADLMSNYGGLPVGIYDAKKKDSNRRESFMYGIELIMEIIACNADKQELFLDMFFENMVKSEEKAKSDNK